MNTQPSSTPFMKWLLYALFFIAWCVFIGRAYQVFGPESIYVQPFNSDSALPVLMSNDDRIDLFRTYIYGQDQIGAWPFLFGQIVRRLTGYVWTPHSVYLMQVFWLSLSVFLIAALCRGGGLLVGVLLASLFTLHPVVSQYFFVLNQRNAWQVTALFLAWWSLRQVSERSYRDHFDARAIWPWILALLVSAFLANWTASLSKPLVLLICVLELTRAHLVARERRVPGPHWLIHATALFVPLVSAFFLEFLLKANYHRFALQHYGSDFRTPVEIDWGYMWVNLYQLWRVFVSAPGWPLTLAGLVGSVLLLICLIHALFGGVTMRRLLHPGIRLDLCVLGCTAGLIALANFCIAVPFTWVRLNSYGPRYLAQTHMFGALTALLFLTMLVTLLPRVYANRHIILKVLATASLVMLALKFPPIQSTPHYEKLRQIAVGLTSKSSNVVLLGGYWDTYVFAALAPPGAITPVPAENQLVRTPWTPEFMRTSPQVIVVHNIFDYSGPIETPSPFTNFGDGQSPPEIITQHGATLRLATPRWFEGDGHIFSLYDNVASRAGNLPDSVERGNSAP